MGTDIVGTHVAAGRLALARWAIACVLMGLLLSGIAAGSPRAQSTRSVPIDEVSAACGTDNPFIAMVCVDRVMLFQDTVGDRPHYSLGFHSGARESDIGAVWGLAYSVREQAIYASATHRLKVPFGPGGPGAIYRLDMASGDVTLPIVVPDAGENHHMPDARGSDAPARYWAGKTSLGDITLDETETNLFVTNLDNRRIYRYRLADGQLISSFDIGGLDEPWADDARPWGLAVHANTLFHAVINSAETSLRRADLGVTVYASDFDGAGMYAALASPLDYQRPAIRIPGSVPRTEWEPWRNRSFQTEFNIHPMPIGADIAMASDGSLAVGLKDRLGDMVPPGGSIGEGVVQSPLDPLIFGVALGDVLYAPRAADGWLPADPYHYFPFRPFWPRWPQGGMAAMGISDTIAMSSLDVDTEGGGNAIWHQRALWLTGTSTLPARQEYGCELSRQQLASPLGRRVIAAPQSRPAADNEIAFKMVSAPGDVELLCAPTVHPTPTLTKTPLISPTPSSTRTPSPTRTQTPTPTDTATETPTATPSTTREPAPIYLPITLTEPRCLPIHPKLDIILVLDASTSMRELTRAGRPKIDAAVAAARDFLTRLNLAPDGDHAGLVSFNAAATLDSSLTADRAALDAALGRVALAQFTRIDLGLDAAAAELAGPRRRADATAAVILLTDGRSNPVPVSEAERAAGVVKAAGARLFTIGLGQDVDAEALRAMASQAADYFEAPDGEDLGAIYGAISAALPCAPYSYWP